MPNPELLKNGKCTWSGRKTNHDVQERRGLVSRSAKQLPVLPSPGKNPKRLTATRKVVKFKPMPSHRFLRQPQSRLEPKLKPRMWNVWNILLYYEQEGQFIVTRELLWESHHDFYCVSSNNPQSKCADSEPINAAGHWKISRRYYQFRINCEIKPNRLTVSMAPRFSTLHCFKDTSSQQLKNMAKKFFQLVQTTIATAPWIFVEKFSYQVSTVNQQPRIAPRQVEYN